MNKITRYNHPLGFGGERSSRFDMAHDAALALAQLCLTPVRHFGLEDEAVLCGVSPPGGESISMDTNSFPRPGRKRKRDVEA